MFSSALELSEREEYLEAKRLFANYDGDIIDQFRINLYYIGAIAWKLFAVPVKEMNHHFFESFAYQMRLHLNFDIVIHVGKLGPVRFKSSLFRIKIEFAGCVYRCETNVDTYYPTINGRPIEDTSITLLDAFIRIPSKVKSARLVL